VLKGRWAARGRVATIRDAFARSATTTLRETLTDVQVSLKYDQNAYSPDGASLIVQAMAGGRISSRVLPGLWKR